MTKLCELLVNQVKSNGWLSISSITCDNASVYNIFNCSGAIGIDETNNLLIVQSTEDITNSTKIVNQLAIADRHKFGQLRTTCFQDLDCLQWWQGSTFTVPSTFSFDVPIDELADQTWPTATFPTEDEIMACTYDEETKTWSGSDKITTALNAAMYSDISVIPMYSFDDVRVPPSAIVAEWKRWYAQHQAFTTYINSQYGLTII